MANLPQVWRYPVGPCSTVRRMLRQLWRQHKSCTHAPISTQHHIDPGASLAYCPLDISGGRAMWMAAESDWTAHTSFDFLVMDVNGFS